VTVRKKDALLNLAEALRRTPNADPDETKDVAARLAALGVAAPVGRGEPWARSFAEAVARAEREAKLVLAEIGVGPAVPTPARTTASKRRFTEIPPSPLPCAGSFP